MAKRPTTDELETVAALRVAIRAFLAATDEVTRAHGLTPRQYDLLALLHRPGRSADLTAAAIAEELSLSRSATTELLTRASQAGLLERRSGGDDMRFKPLAPTRDGSARFFAAVKDLRADRSLALLRVAAALAEG